MLEKIHTFFSKKELASANRKLDRKLKSSAARASAPKSDTPVARRQSLSQEDAVLIAEQVEKNKNRQARFEKERWLDGFYSGITPLMVGATVMACGAAAAAGAILGYVAPSINPAVAAFCLATGGYFMGSLFTGQVGSYKKTLLTSAGMGLVAGATNLVLPGSSAVLAGVGAIVLGSLTMYAVAAKARF